MRGVTHGLSAGAVYATWGEVVKHQSVPVLVTGTAIAIGAGVLSDIDTRGSCVARSFGWITEVMAAAVHKLAGGHREGTHSAIGDGICALIAVLAIALEPVHFHVHVGPVARELSMGRIMLALYLALLFGAGMKALRHPRRDLRRELLAIGGAVAMAWSGWDAGGIAWAILIGTAVHAAGDGLTEHGVPYLLPLTNRCYHLLPKHLRISTGHATERLFIAPACVLALILLAVNAVAPGAELSLWAHVSHAI